MNRHFSAKFSPGAKLVVAIAPEFTMGLVRPSSPRSTPSTELKARPVALTPIFSRTVAAPRCSATNAKMNGFDTLMIVNS
jgi:hypothetical protein